MANERRSARWFWLLLVVVLFAGAGAGAVWYLRQPRSEQTDFKTATVQRGDVIQTVTANGQLNAVKNVQVGSQISGIIKEIRVDFNSRVQEGDIVAQIDSSTHEQNVTQAEAELATAKAALELAEMRNRSTQALLRSSLVSAEEAERVGVDLHQAQAAVQMRQAALKRAQVDFSRTTIYAPISGVVISRNVDVGQTVAASFNTPTLFLIANDLSKMQIDAMVSEADVGGVEESQKVTFTVDAFPTRQFEGLVKQVRFAPTTNQNVVNYATIVEVNNADLKLRPGMTANATIITAQRTNVLKIPNAALRFRPPEQLAAKESGRGGEPGGKADATNRLAMARGGDPSAAGPASPQPDAGEGRPGREEMRRRFESLPPEQQAAIRERMRARFGEGGPPGGPGGMPPLGGFPGMGGRGGGPRASSGEPVTRTVYVLGKEPSPTGGERAAPKPVRVKVGITDNASTEVLEGLKEGDVVLTGLNTPQLASQTNVLRSPFGGPFGMRPPR